SASSNTSIGSLPPSSTTTGTSRSAAATPTRLPVATLPVNIILSTPASTRAAPVAPSPATTLNSPSGRPARANTSPIFKPTSGVNSLGFNTTPLPAINAITTSPVGIAQGHFDGEMMPTTPN